MRLPHRTASQRALTLEITLKLHFKHWKLYRSEGVWASNSWMNYYASCSQIHLLRCSCRPSSSESRTEAAAPSTSASHCSWSIFVLCSACWPSFYLPSVMHRVSLWSKNRKQYTKIYEYPEHKKWWVGVDTNTLGQHPLPILMTLWTAGNLIKYFYFLLQRDNKRISEQKFEGTALHISQ